MSRPGRRPRPASTVATVEISIMTGNAINMGPRALADPDRYIAAITPMLATGITTVNSPRSGPDDGGDGSSGGASTVTSAVATGGGGRRATGAKPRAIFSLPGR